jgi:predicted enzyme related to lactoylglutathione lyase
VHLAPFWSVALGYEIGDLDRAGTYLDLVPPNDRLPVVYLQRVSEPKTVKNRLHLDLHTPDVDQLISVLVDLGGQCSGAPRTGSEGGWWQVMTDPDGNEFCICRSDDPIDREK